MKEHNFHQSIIVGSEGEKIIFELLKTKEKILTVEDVVGIDEFRKIDVDFVVTTTDEQILYYELKTEPAANKTKNFFYEITSNESYNTPGCFMYSQADYWMSFIPQSGELYIFPMEECRKYVNKAKKFYSLKKVFNGHYYSSGYAIPITEVCNNVKFNLCNVKDIVSYDYIEEDKNNKIKPEFKNVIWK